METPIALPDKPSARELSWVMDSTVARSTSPFSLTEQVYAWPGQRWSVIMKLPPMLTDEALAWQAFFADLNGVEGTFWAGEPGFLRTPDVDFGMPYLDGDHSAGAAVKTAGWNPDQRVLYKGQKIELAGRIRQALADTYSDDTGLATVRCWPHARSLSGEVPLIWQNPQGVFRLRSVPEFTWDKHRMQAGFQFSADEVILP